MKQPCPPLEIINGCRVDGGTCLSLATLPGSKHFSQQFLVLVLLALVDVTVPELLAVVKYWICRVRCGHVGRCLLVERFYGNGSYYMGSAWRVGGCGLGGGERRETMTSKVESS